MATQSEADTAKDAGARTGRDPVVLAAAGSVLLAWFQFYVRGNRTHGLFIGLWPPTLLAFSNAISVNAIMERIESSAADLSGRLTENR